MHEARAIDSKCTLFITDRMSERRIVITRFRYTHMCSLSRHNTGCATLAEGDSFRSASSSRLLRKLNGQGYPLTLPQFSNVFLTRTAGHKYPTSVCKRELLTARPHRTDTNTVFGRAAGFPIGAVPSFMSGSLGGNKQEHSDYHGIQHRFCSRQLCVLKP